MRRYPLDPASTRRSALSNDRGGIQTPQQKGVFVMFTIRNLGGVALFLFGTTFLWLTPSFAGQGVSTKATSWSVTNALALLALVGFTVATWGLFKKYGWWEPTAIVAAVVGVIVLIPYWVAFRETGQGNPLWNVFIHVLGDAGVFVLLLVPTLEQWVDRHVVAGR